MWTFIWFLLVGFNLIALGIVIGWDAGRRAGYDQGYADGMCLRGGKKG